MLRTWDAQRRFSGRSPTRSSRTDRTLPRLGGACGALPPGSGFSLWTVTLVGPCVGGRQASATRRRKEAARGLRRRVPGVCPWPPQACAWRVPVAPERTDRWSNRLGQRAPSCPGAPSCWEVLLGALGPGPPLPAGQLSPDKSLGSGSTGGPPPARGGARSLDAADSQPGALCPSVWAGGELGGAGTSPARKPRRPWLTAPPLPARTPSPGLQAEGTVVTTPPGGTGGAFVEGLGPLPSGAPGAGVGA